MALRRFVCCCHHAPIHQAHPPPPRVLWRRVLSTHYFSLLLDTIFFSDVASQSFSFIFFSICFRLYGLYGTYGPSVILESQADGLSRSLDPFGSLGLRLYGPH